MSGNIRKNISKLKKKSIWKFKYISLLNPFLKYPETKFAVYTRGRTGSTLLSDLMNCHKDIYSDVEIFNFLYSGNRVLFPMAYIESCSKRASALNKSVYGFKVKIAQLKNEHKYKNYEKILSGLHNKGWKFIYLKRENYLRHKLSNLLITETNVYHLTGNDQPYRKKINVDCQLLLDSIKFGEETELLEKQNLKNIPYLEIIYERDLLDNSRHQETADRIFGFLGVDSHKVKTAYRKVTPDDLRDSIENYDEVLNFFKNTKYFDLLK